MQTRTVISLPRPRKSSKRSFEQCVAARESVRDFDGSALRLSELGQLCWAGHGLTQPEEERYAVPSAGGLYPLKLYLLANNVARLRQGLYRYLPDTHQLQCVRPGSFAEALVDIAYDQTWLQDSAVVFLIVADRRPTKKRYGRDATRYVLIETGHVGQNILLQASSLSLGATTVGAFSPARIKKLFKLSSAETPYYLLAAGFRN